MELHIMEFEYDLHLSCYSQPILYKTEHVEHVNQISIDLKIK